MSHRAFHQSEALSGFLFEQPLDFELGFRSAAECRSQMKHGLAFWRASFERRLYQHERCTAQNSIDEKKVFEAVCVNSRNSPPLLNSHSKVLPARFVATTAKGKLGMPLTYVASELSSHPALCGGAMSVPAGNRVMLHFGTFATGAIA